LSHLNIMSAALPHHLGPVRWVHLPHPAGSSAQAIAGAWLAQQLALTEDELNLDRDQHGRPYLRGLAADTAAPDISWSHSGEHLLVALSEGVDVGADLERQRPRPRALELARRFFAPSESRWLAQQPADQQEGAFVRLWCAKEAVLKAHGRGIAFGLHRFCVGERDSAMQLVHADPELGPVEAWTLQELTHLPGYHATIAWRRRS